MTRCHRIALIFGIAISCGWTQTAIVLQPVKELDRSADLATCDYHPIQEETVYTTDP